MEEKLIEKEQKEANVEKRAYTPPTVIVYGKVTELTAGGTAGTAEAGSSSKNRQFP